MSVQNEVRIVEVGPRDGLQNLSDLVSTADKIDMIQHLAACGFAEIQAGAFVSPQAIPQFQDMSAVMEGVKNIRRATLTALVPNIQGVRDALRCGLKKINFFFSVSRSHNINNVRQTPDASLTALEGILSEIRPDSSLAVRVDIATAFGCPFEGPVAIPTVLDYVEKLAGLGVLEMTLCDTAGLGNPRLVEALGRQCIRLFPEVTFGMHFHDTRGLGLANILRAYEAGIRCFDGAVGGLGGCPYSPGASGTVATEETVFMFEEMGISTGIDLPALLAAALKIREKLSGAIFRSALLDAGLPAPRGALK